MPYEVRTSHADPRVLAAVRATTTRPRLGTDIIRLLDQIWPVLRAEGVRTGHNVVLYYGGSDAAMAIAAGVEVFSDFTRRGEVQRMTTPPGEVAAVTYWGEYSEMAPAYAAIGEWWTAHRRRPAGVSWEVYGDWADDPAQRRTDIYFLLEPLAG